MAIGLVETLNRVANRPPANRPALSRVEAERLVVAEI